ncbi:SSI family serine proteinase inhibitor [Amycolatopsis suaedae]|uniref:Protease n=1 Tax=Amycolatopsis suaedae TaxID=2510978 RepID=A0A4Q7IZA5_9PSEU|nr:SSI family serine proteinase inhibitor [Amycolatopsis suaedae]RZQ60370.1 protease [Amycolatopsis suaedae]
MAFLPFEPITACALTLACLGAPAPGDASLTLTQHESSGAAAIVTLHCDPVSGTHPDADRACATLSDAGGDFARIESEDAACTLEYAPIEVHARGNWHGKRVEYATTYPNRCVAVAESRGVFGF